MKYQKSTLKILESLWNEPNKEFNKEELIKKSKTGRNSAFNSIKWLKNNNFIELKVFGRQEIIKLEINENTLNIKYFLDVFNFKNIKPELRYKINIISYMLSSLDEIEAIILFGSSLKKDKPNDIDLLVIYKKDIKNKINEIRNFLEEVLDIIINVHYSEKIDLLNFSKGIILYRKDKLNKELIKESNLKNKFIEILKRKLAIINNIDNKNTTLDLVKLLINDIAFIIYDDNNLTKEEAVEKFKNKYKLKNKSINKLFEVIDKVGIDIFS